MTPVAPGYSDTARAAVEWELSMLIAIFRSMALDAGPHVAELSEIWIRAIEDRRAIVARGAAA
jgi:hypothetical protein